MEHDKTDEAAAFGRRRDDDALPGVCGRPSGADAGRGPCLRGSSHLLLDRVLRRRQFGLGLVERQEPDGSWAREPLVGVFNRTCLINYDNYRHYFPAWALAEWAQR